MKLKSTACASVDEPGITVVALAEGLVTLTVLEPVIVKLVTVDVFHTVPTEVTVILPVPNAIVLALALLELNAPQVKVKLSRSNVPAVKVYVPVAVKA